MSDLHWMTLAISKDFAIITGDRNERTRGLTTRDLKAMGARVLFLGSFWDSLSIWSKSKWIVAKWDMIVRTFDEMPAGSCVLISASGKVTEL